MKQSTITIIFIWAVLFLSGCVVDPGRIRLRYPHDLEYVANYFSDEHQWGRWEVYQIELVDEFIVLVSTELSIVNIKNPSHPYLVGSYAIPWESVDDVFIQDRLVFLASKNYGLAIIDISQIDQPVPISSFTLKGDNDTTVVATGNYVYYYFPYGLNQKRHGYILDISNLPEISVVTNTTEIGKPLAVEGNYIYTAHNINTVEKTEAIFQIIEVSNDGLVTILSELSFENARIVDIAVSEGVAFVSGGNNIQFIDVTDPHSPKLLGSKQNHQGAIGSFVNIAVDDNILVGDFIYSLHITIDQGLMDVEPLARLDRDKFNSLLCDKRLFPVYQSEFISEKMRCPNSVLRLSPNDVALQNGYVYIATEQAGLLIFKLPDLIQQ